jgi:hypothetical protein
MRRLFSFGCCLFGYLPEPIKESLLLSRESQQRQPPLPKRLPPDFKAVRHWSLPHPDLRSYEATLQIPETTFLPMRASLDPSFLQRSSSSRYDQVVQRLSTTMKTVAKGILKDHLVLVADSMMSTGIKKRFNNAGYKATFRPLKVQVPITKSTLFTPMKCMRRLQERCHPNPLGCVVSSCSWGKHAVLGTELSFEILQWKSAKKQQEVWW